MHTPFASSGMFFFQFVARFLLAFSPFHESLSLVLFLAGRYGFWTRDM